MAETLRRAGFLNVEDKRHSGVLSFNSAQEYWDTLVAGAGKTRSMLGSLSPEVREAIRQESMQSAQIYQKDSKLEIPYEVVLAQGKKG